jgi:Zn-dependent metalloprotease
MKYIKRTLVIIVLFFVGVVNGNSQKVYKHKNNMKNFILKSEIAKKSISSYQIKNELHKYFDLPTEYEFKTYVDKYKKPIKEEKDCFGYTHERLNQLYKGIKVEDSDIRVQYKKDTVVSVNGVYTNETGINITPALDKVTAIEKALEFVNAKQYKWEIPTENIWLQDFTNDPTATFYPDPELVICKNSFNLEDTILHLAYKMDIYALEPLSRNYIYVDAIKGSIINKRTIINTYGENADTRYSGSRFINTKYQSNGYDLFDDTRGYGIKTLNLRNFTNKSSSIPFTDVDNNWTSSEYDNLNKDDAALDAHWGLMMTYDYFKNNFERDSYDNIGSAINCYVHYGSGYDNAFWDGNSLYFGDGSYVEGNPPYSNANYDAWTSLDIVAHEYAHAFCQSTANLNYDGESGAINEGLSDIWAACVKNYTDPNKNTWSFGSEIMRYGYSCLRSMSDPKTSWVKRPQPDTYGEPPWVNTYNCDPYIESDYCGVHINSGVMNYWFYLLVNGGSDTNDLNNAYNVTGIGIDKAAQLVYLTEINMHSIRGFYEARDLFIFYAGQKWGENSPEVISVTNAWYAVGVGPEYQCGSGNWFEVVDETYTIDTSIPVCNIRLINVTVTNGAKLTLNVDKEIEINGKFEVDQTSEFEIN